MLTDIDALIIGAGLSGSVAARILAEAGKKVLVADKRNEIGGNCADERREDSGVIVHKYGPHLFHTNEKNVWEFMNRFCVMDVYFHKVKANIDGKIATLPFNFNTIYELFPKNLAGDIETLLTKTYAYNDTVPILELKKSKETSLNFLADYVYEKVFLNYTLKQWGMSPEEIDSEVTARVPVRIGRDDRYFTDRFQGAPRYGYAEFFKNLLDHKNIRILLNTDFREVLSVKDGKTYFLGEEFTKPVIATCGLDDLFDYKFDALRYRSVNMEFQTIPVDSYQEAATVNYPNNYTFTRITEFKKIHPYGNFDKMTTILKEYPTEYKKGENEPYYPVFNDTAKAMYKKYEDMAKAVKNLVIVGRLAEYKYYDMDDAILNAMKKVEHL